MKSVGMNSGGRKNVSEIVPRIVGPFERYCSASGMQPTDAYVTTPLIGIGVTRRTCSHSGSRLLDDIIAFDRAEASAANITQTNLVAVSSFNGLQGLLLGYDLLPQTLRSHPLLPQDTFPRVFDVQPLLSTTQALYGTVADPRFPVAPGQHLLCAYKTCYQDGPCVVYGALAIAIAADRSRHADLFLEDHGTLVGTHGQTGSLETASTDAAEREGKDGADAGQQVSVLEHLIDAVGQIGDNLGVRYDKILIGFRSQTVQAGEVGCVLTAAPYVHLAQKAVPHGRPELLREISLADWEQAVQGHYLER